MAPNKSLYKRTKPSRRFNSSVASVPMSSSSTSLFNCSRVALLTSMAAVLGFVVLLGISSKLRSGFVTVDRTPKIHAIQVLNEFPHDAKAFTQGLLYAGNDKLFESTGLYGQSSVRRVALQTGKVEILHMMERSYFGEGLTLLGDRLFQVTWLTKTGFIYDRKNLTKIEKFTHQMQDGWGLATDGKALFGSDGSSTLYKLDPQTLKVIEKHIVKYNDREVHYLNELEFVNDEVWANVWQTDCIARISQEDGSVLGWVLLQNLRKELLAAGNNQIDVLNGIAWDSKENRLFVTGKLWPKLYEVRLHPVQKHLSERRIEELCIPNHL